jgi:hypothetical protein
MAGNQTASWNASQLEYERIEQVLESINYWAYRANVRDCLALEPYFSAVRVLWGDVKPCIDRTPDRTEVDGMITSIRSELTTWIKKNYAGGFPMDLLEKIIKFHDQVMQLRHVSGMGVKTFREKSSDERFREGLGLPEHGNKEEK